MSRITITITHEVVMVLFFFSTLFPRACQLPRRSSIFRLSSIRESNWERETLRIIETYRGHIVQVHTNTHTHTYKVVNATSPYATCRGVIDFSWIRLIGEFLPIIRPPMFKLPFFASRLAIKTERSNRLTICRRNLKKIDSKLIQNWFKIAHFSTDFETHLRKLCIF